MAIYKNSAPIVTNGLILYLDAANPQSYVSGSTVCRDLSSNNNSGSLNNGTLYNNLGFFTFDGVNDNLVVNNNNSLNLSGSSVTLSSELLININTYKNIAYVNSKGQSGVATNNSYGFVCTDTSLYFRISNGISTINSPIISNTNLPANRWGHVVAVLDTSFLRIYLNGTQINPPTSRTIDILPNVENLFISSDVYSLSGSISLSKIYNRALSQAEVTQNYNAMKSRFNLS